MAHIIPDFRRWKDVLINHLTTEVDLYKGRVKDLRLIHYVIMSVGMTSCPITEDSSSLIQVIIVSVKILKNQPLGKSCNYLEVEAVISIVLLQSNVSKTCRQNDKQT